MRLDSYFYPMQVEIISIGDELLIGQTINTNASWLGSELSLGGVSVRKCTVIADVKDHITAAIDSAMKSFPLVIMTGGLGPTKDDITKDVLCSYFDTELVENEQVLERIKDYFEKRGRPMLESNNLQASLPEKCTVLFNNYGTASGMWFEKNGSILVSLPGVPYEMKGIFLEEVFPRLKERFSLNGIYHITVMTQGIGESFLAEKIGAWEDKIRAEGFGLAYLPSPGSVRLRLSSDQGERNKDKIQAYMEELVALIPSYAYSIGEVSLSEVVGGLLRKQKLTVGTVESCTGGKLSGEIISVPGSSDYFLGGLVTYSNDMKSSLVDVPVEILNEQGAVSKEVVKLMAENGRSKLNTDICISVSGISGPEGGSDDKPVGTVWIGISTSEVCDAYHFTFGGNRERNIQISVLTALNLLRCKLLGVEIENK
jgi:nicotinamide-nucleotide amidase